MDNEQKIKDWLYGQLSKEEVELVGKWLSLPASNEGFGIKFYGVISTGIVLHENPMALSGPDIVSLTMPDRIHFNPVVNIPMRTSEPYPDIPYSPKWKDGKPFSEVELVPDPEGEKPLDIPE